MDFANEQYVRLYVRDTTGWRLLGWEGRTVFVMLYRKANLGGAIGLHGLEAWELATVHCELPEDVAKVGMSRCLQRGWMVVENEQLVFPDYVEANRVARTDKQRAREARARKALLESQNVTAPSQTVMGASQNGAFASHAVTARHDASQNVTPANGTANSLALAIQGRVWLAGVLGRDDYDHRGKWAHAFEQMALKPEAERRAVAAALAKELDKPGVRRKLTPQHVLDYWATYVDGQSPRGFAEARAAAAVSSEPSALQKLQAQWRELSARRRECLFDEVKQKQRLTEQMAEVSKQIEALKGQNHGRV